MDLVGTTVKKVLRKEQLSPDGKRGGPSWRELLRAQANSVIAVKMPAYDNSHPRAFSRAPRDTPRAIAPAIAQTPSTRERLVILIAGSRIE